MKRTMVIDSLRKAGRGHSQSHHRSSAANEITALARRQTNGSRRKIHVKNNLRSIYLKMPAT